MYRKHEGLRVTVPLKAAARALAATLPEEFCHVVTCGEGDACVDAAANRAAELTLRDGVQRLVLHFGEDGDTWFRLPANVVMVKKLRRRDGQPWGITVLGSRVRKLLLSLVGTGNDVDTAIAFELAGIDQSSQHLFRIGLTKALAAVKQVASQHASGWTEVLVSVLSSCY